jgi:pSer/pThr/pTyr-binding forkhead associated (FHA) protein
MALEIRIMTGARAGQVVHLDTPLVTVGRQAGMDVRFDAQKDLDVSGRHAEIRLADGAYTLQDLGSTNGTFVNGEQLQGARVLRSATACSSAPRARTWRSASIAVCEATPRSASR